MKVKHRPSGAVVEMSDEKAGRVLAGSSDQWEPVPAKRGRRKATETVEDDD